MFKSKRTELTDWNENGADMGVWRKALSTVLNDRASLSAEMALRLERQFKVSADTLKRKQTSYDLAQARLQLVG
jgi:addiction module HigA family antidote